MAKTPKAPKVVVVDLRGEESGLESELYYFVEQPGLVEAVKDFETGYDAHVDLDMNCGDKDDLTAKQRKYMEEIEKVGNESKGDPAAQFVGFMEKRGFKQARTRTINLDC